MARFSSTITTGADGTVEYHLEPSEARAVADIPTEALENWTFVDTETDGLWDPIYVIEIAAQRFHGLTPIGEPFKVFLDHGIEIPVMATAVHGYTTDFIRENGIDPKSAYAAFREYVGDSYVSSHYLIFDWDRVLVPELTRLGEAPIGKRGFCTWFLSRRSLPEFKTHRLDYLREVFTLACSRAHSAVGDVEAVVDLLLRVIFPRLSRAGMSDIGSVANFSRLKPLALCRERLTGIEIGVPYREIVYVNAEADLRKAARDRAREKLARFKEEQQLKEEAEFLVHSGTSLPQLLIQYHMLEETPDVGFEGEMFVFTGTMAWGSRPEAEKEIIDRGGLMAKTKAMSQIDYLVLGEDPEMGWMSGNSVTKLGNAFVHKFTNPNSRLKIIRERDFIAAL
jgi:DNA polymerase III epsilon subunit-like protein